MKIGRWLLCSAVFVCMDAWAQGPTGIGSLQLGLTPEQVTALPESGVHLAAPLGPYQSPGGRPVELKPGEERFDTKIQTPWSDGPLKATLTFNGGTLTSMYVNLDDSEALVKTVAAQIEEKFGAPQVTDSRTVERCPSYAGGTEEVRSGSLYNIWNQDKGNKVVRTNVGTYVLDGCLGRRYNERRKVLASISVFTVEASKNPF